MKDRFPMHLQDCLFFKQEFKLKEVCFTGARFQGENVIGFSDGKAVWNTNGDVTFSRDLLA